jgi:hypothetical protein
MVGLHSSLKPAIFQGYDRKYSVCWFLCIVYVCFLCARTEVGIFLFLKTARPVMVPTQSATGGLPGAVFVGHYGWNVHLTNHLRLKSRLRMSGAVPALPLCPHALLRHSFTSQRLWVECGRLPLRLGAGSQTISSDIFGTFFFNSGLYLTWRHNGFLPRPFCFIIHYCLWRGIQIFQKSRTCFKHVGARRWHDSTLGDHKC